jgi:hypothetical protein
MLGAALGAVDRDRSPANSNRKQLIILHLIRKLHPPEDPQNPPLPTRKRKNAKI